MLCPTPISFYFVRFFYKRSRLIMKILFLILIVVVAVNGIQGKCKCDCPLNDPVCGKDSRTGEKETFGSPCALKCYNCTNNKHFVPIKQGSC